MTSLPDKQSSVDSLDSNFRAFLLPQQQFDLHSLARQPSSLSIIGQCPKLRTYSVETAESQKLPALVPMAFGPILSCYDWDRGEDVNGNLKTPLLEEMMKAKL